MTILRTFRGVVETSQSSERGDLHLSLMQENRYLASPPTHLRIRIPPEPDDEGEGEGIWSRRQRLKFAHVLCQHLVPTPCVSCIVPESVSTSSLYAPHARPSTPFAPASFSRLLAYVPALLTSLICHKTLNVQSSTDCTEYLCAVKPPYTLSEVPQSHHVLAAPSSCAQRALLQARKCIPSVQLSRKRKESEISPLGLRLSEGNHIQMSSYFQMKQPVLLESDEYLQHPHAVVGEDKSPNHDHPFHDGLRARPFGYTQPISVDEYLHH